MRRAPILVLAVLLAGPVLAEETRVEYFSSLEAKAYRRQATPVNPANRQRQPGATFEAAAVIDLEHLGTKARFRLEDTERFDERDGGARGKVLELSRQEALGESLRFFYGKRTLDWDPGLMFRPLNFFAPAVSQTDLRDDFRRVEGVPLVGLTWLEGKTGFSLVGAWDFEHDRDGANAGLAQWAAQATREEGRWSYAAVLQQGEQQRVGLGGSMSTSALSDDVVLHASGFVRQGTTRPIHRDIAEGRISYSGSNPMGSHRAGDDHYYPRAAVGLNWALDASWSVQGELYHDEAGLDRGEWAAFRDLVAAHQDYRRFSPRASEGFLLRDGKQLGFPARQDYLFLRLAWAEGAKWESTASAILGADGSHWPRLSVAFLGFAHIKLHLSAGFARGPEGSEAALGSRAADIAFGIRAIF
ncbi:MAG: hypothetical protein FJX47_04115 [Alphaproteobacteria bacterium]|nr:hypothetical protein [Alphaproteobacteria bacterium]